MPPYPIVVKWLWRELRITILIALASTFMFSPLANETLVSNLIYSFAVTFCIQALIETGRYGLSTRPFQRASTGPRRGTPERLVPSRRWPGWPLMAPWVALSAIAGYLGGHAFGDLVTGTHRAPLGFLRRRSPSQSAAPIFSTHAHASPRPRPGRKPRYVRPRKTSSSCWCRNWSRTCCSTRWRTCAC
jgi:hypothetical protein